MDLYRDYYRGLVYIGFYTALRKTKLYYAHIEIVVTFLVVNIFGLLVIARNPPGRF